MALEALSQSSSGHRHDLDAERPRSIAAAYDEASFDAQPKAPNLWH
jgi:hypothetical protein